MDDSRGDKEVIIQRATSQDCLDVVNARQGLPTLDKSYRTEDFMHGGGVHTRCLQDVELCSRLYTIKRLGRYSTSHPREDIQFARGIAVEESYDRLIAAQDV